MKSSGYLWILHILVSPVIFFFFFFCLTNLVQQNNLYLKIYVLIPGSNSISMTDLKS